MPNPYLTNTGARRVNPYLQPVEREEKGGFFGALAALGREGQMAKYANRGRRSEMKENYRRQQQMPDPRQIQQANYWNAQQDSAADVWKREDAEKTRMKTEGGVQDSWIDTMKAFSANPKNKGRKFPITNAQWGQMAQSTRDKAMMAVGGGGGIGGGPSAAQAKITKDAADAKNSFQNVVDKGFFTGTIEDFGALTPSDRSSFVKLAATPKAYMDAKMIRDEYSGENYTAESWELAQKTGDAMALVPKPSEFAGVSKDVMDQEISRSKEYNKEMAPIRAVQENHAKMMAGLNSGKGAGDMAAIFTFMKTLDPPSTVREGEFALASQIGGVRDKWLQTYDKWNKGDILSPAARQQLADLSDELVKLTQQSRDGIRSDYIYRNERYGLDEKAVLGSRLYDYDNLPKYKAPGSGPKTPAVTSSPEMESSIDALIKMGPVDRSMI